MSAFVPLYRRLSGSFLKRKSVPSLRGRVWCLDSVPFIRQQDLSNQLFFVPTAVIAALTACASNDRNAAYMNGLDSSLSKLTPYKKSLCRTAFPRLTGMFAPAVSGLADNSRSTNQHAGLSIAWFTDRGPVRAQTCAGCCASGHHPVRLGAFSQVSGATVIVLLGSCLTLGNNMMS
jgi:hypothetical protein